MLAGCAVASSTPTPAAPGAVATPGAIGPPPAGARADHQLGGAFEPAAGVAVATQLVALAHASGLAAGQKNAPDVAERGSTSVGFDFVTAEECVAFEECAAAFVDVQC